MNFLNCLEPINTVHPLRVFSLSSKVLLQAYFTIHPELSRFPQALFASDFKFIIEPKILIGIEVANEVAAVFN